MISRNILQQEIASNSDSFQAVPSDEAIIKELNHFVKHNDLEKLSFRQIRTILETTMHISDGLLKTKKQLILDFIMEIMEVNLKRKEKEQEQLTFSWKQLTRFSKACGKSPAVFRDLNDLSLKEKIQSVRERLQMSGQRFSDPPTDEEIVKAQNLRDKQKDLEGIDVTQIISGSRKRGHELLMDSLGSQKYSSKQEQGIIYDRHGEAIGDDKSDEIISNDSSKRQGKKPLKIYVDSNKENKVNCSNAFPITDSYQSKNSKHSLKDKEVEEAEAEFE